MVDAQESYHANSFPFRRDVVDALEKDGNSTQASIAKLFKTEIRSYTGRTLFKIAAHGSEKEKNADSIVIKNVTLPQIQPDPTCHESTQECIAKN